MIYRINQSEKQKVLKYEENYRGRWWKCLSFVGLGPFVKITKYNVDNYLQFIGQLYIARYIIQYFFYEDKI